ncbi:Uncharacterised protein [uncultured archaeon]|nr:Uncharacterised protein [uncultured archaeon]
MKITKKTTTILFAAVLLVSAVMAVTVFAYPMGIGKEREHAKLDSRSLLVGQGFALNGDEYHILDVAVVNEKRNNSQMATAGHLRFAGQAYALKVTGYDNQSLNGDVLTLPPRGTNRTGFTPATVGHMSLSISKYEGVLLSKGTLTMNNTDYNVLLSSSGQHDFKGTFKSHNSKG